MYTKHFMPNAKEKKQPAYVFLHDSDHSDTLQKLLP